MVPPNRVKMGWQQGIKLLCFIVKWLYCSASLIVILLNGYAKRHKTMD